MSQRYAPYMDQVLECYHLERDDRQIIRLPPYVLRRQLGAEAERRADHRTC